MKTGSKEYQVGVFPVTGDGRVVLVTRRRGRGWIFPKGKTEKGRSDRAVAKDEAYEEAGVYGALESGFEEFRTKAGKAPRLRLFRMEVTSITNSFPEADERRRVVVSFEQAEKMLREDLRLALRKMRDLELQAA